MVEENLMLKSSLKEARMELKRLRASKTFTSIVLEDDSPTFAEIIRESQKGNAPNGSNPLHLKEAQSSHLM